MDSLLQMLSDWRVLAFAGIIAIYGISRFFKPKSSSEDIGSLVERFHNELAAAESAVAHDASHIAFESSVLADPPVDTREQAEVPEAVG